MNEKTILCLCGEKYDEINLKKHIRICDSFLNRFRLFDYKISRLLNEYLINQQHCFLVKFMFKRYIKRIDKKLKNEQININYKKKPKNQINEQSLLYPQKSGTFLHKNYFNKIFEGKNNNIYDNMQKSAMNLGIKDDEINHKKIMDFNDNKFGLKKIFSYFSYDSCRFCGNKKEKSGQCQNSRCVEYSKIACNKKLPCKHDCLGIFNALICLPCLDKKCKNYGGVFDQNKDSSCQICLEKLSSSPIVSLSCDHYFHYFCIKKKLENSQNLSGDISYFHFLKCPICDSVYECPSVPQFQKIIEKYKNLYIKVKVMIEQRISYRKLSLQKNTNPFDLFLFFLCHKCKQPYYAGNKNNNLIVKKENNEHCLCGKDSFLRFAKGDSFCEKHGLAYIEYKCKLCCNIASRFILETHLCEECYENKNSVKKRCFEGNCEFKGIHAPNGIEYCLGCFICRYNNVKNYSQNFINI